MTPIQKLQAMTRADVMMKAQSIALERMGNPVYWVQCLPDAYIAVYDEQEEGR